MINFKLADDEGFEPPVPNSTLPFQGSTFSRSDNRPTSNILTNLIKKARVYSIHLL